MLYFPPPFKFCGNFGDADDDDIQVGLTPSSELEYRSRGDGPWHQGTKRTLRHFTAKSADYGCSQIFGVVIVVVGLDWRAGTLRMFIAIAHRQ